MEISVLLSYVVLKFCWLLHLINMGFRAEGILYRGRESTELLGQILAIGLWARRGIGVS